MPKEFRIQASYPPVHELHMCRAVIEHLHEQRQCRNDHVQGAERQRGDRRQERQ